MAPLPLRSPGVLAAPLGELIVLYDLVTEVVHVLNPSAGLVWLACDGQTDLEGAVRPIVEATGADPARVGQDVTGGVEQLGAAGLVGRTSEPPTPPAVDRPTVEGSVTSAVHAVLDDGVRFRGEDAALLASIDGLLGFDDPRAATVDLGVQEAEDGTVRLVGWGPPRVFGSRHALLDALPSLLNLVAAASSSCVALHSGAVRSPAGQVVLLPALSGSGKTTLTAALVRAGWAYATDEAVGVRAGSLSAVAYPKPLVLDLEVQGALGLGPTGTLNVHATMLRSDAVVLRGDIGPVRHVVLPRFEAGAAVSVTSLPPREAVIGIIEHALNLARVGEPGLQALCQLAESVPVHRLVHGGFLDAVPAIDALVQGSEG